LPKHRERPPRPSSGRDKVADIKKATMSKWRAALARAGVEFIDAENSKGEVVRFKAPTGKR
jgi:hypothetical protein